MAMIEDVDESWARRAWNLVIVNGHGGNYVLRNAVQQATTVRRRMALFPAAEDWNTARVEAGCETTSHEDMHGGELEVSLLLWGAPQLPREGYQTADHLANDRPDLLTVGMRGYTSSGIIGAAFIGQRGEGRGGVGQPVSVVRPCAGPAGAVKAVFDASSVMSWWLGRRSG